MKPRNGAADRAGLAAPEAVLGTILAGAKWHRLEPWTYLREVILRLSVGGSAESVESLLPDRWAAAHPEHVLTHRLEESHQRARRGDERGRSEQCNHPQGGNFCSQFLTPKSRRKSK
jgi:hypothetical protein